MFANTPNLQIQFSSAQLLSLVQLCDSMNHSTPGLPLSITNSRSSLRLVSIESVMPFSHLILCHPFFSRLQSFPASGSFPVSSFFTSGSQSIGASASVLPMNSQDWFPLGLTSLISLQSKGFSRVFSSTTIQKHQFFSAQPSLWSNSHISAWLLEKPEPWLDRPLSASDISAC